MNRHTQPSSSRKMQPLLTERPGGGAAAVREVTRAKRFGEVAGGTAAECAAICCCCPCTVMSVLVLAVVKAPACLCRKAKQHRRMLRKKRKQQPLLLGPENSVDGGNVGDGFSREELEREVRKIVERSGGKDGGDDEDRDQNGEGSTAVDLEKEMWDQFLGAGFWRSPSQRGLGLYLEGKGNEEKQKGYTTCVFCEGSR